MTDIVQIQESEYDAILRQAVAVIDKTRAMVATTVCSAIGTAHWEIGKLLHDKLSRKKTYSNTVPMGRMLLTPSTSGVRSSHRRTYHLWLLILEESCNQKERHSCRSFDLTIIIHYLFFIVPFLATQHAELPQHGTFIKICPTYLVNYFSVLYKDNHIAIVFQ